MTGARIIAVSQRVDRYPDRNETRDALDQALVRWATAFGHLAVPVPNMLDADALDSLLERLDPAGIILSGGNDIGAEPRRDATESRLFSAALRKNLPLLGICRGMQMIAVASGGTLKKVQGHVRSRHDLGNAFGSVNSYHDMTLDGLPDDFDALAHSEDGEIEAMRHTSLPVLGWMWHPERETPFDPAHVALAKAFFDGSER
ncbi:type 1 glutamine amidotransferase [Minwuia sp.]|uniref:type 1 glutamine amidotransferase n=1 Tax=Minwuia sp. TaxID=2493630 RepID=UPI003A951F49